MFFVRIYITQVHQSLFSPKLFSGSVEWKVSLAGLDRSSAGLYRISAGLVRISAGFDRNSAGLDQIRAGLSAE